MLPKNKIIALKAFKDNYIWILHSNKSNHNSIIVIDPGEAEPVISYIKNCHLYLEAILLTHHHHDHTGGVANLLIHYPQTPVYSSRVDHVPGVNHHVQEGQSIELLHFEHSIDILEIPGHTLGHLAYIYNGALFSGDTVFSIGSGKIFEGSAKQMYDSLEKIKKLPPETLLYCGHEYTLANIRFAQEVEPHNLLLQAYTKKIQNLINQNQSTLPSLLATELQLNPFLRCEEPTIVSQAERYAKKSLPDAIAVLSALREWKNHFNIS